MNELIEERVTKIETSLRGTDDRLGLISRVEIIWRSYNSILILIGHLAGIALGYWLGKG